MDDPCRTIYIGGTSDTQWPEYCDPFGEGVWIASATQSLTTPWDSLEVLRTPSAKFRGNSLRSSGESLGSP